MAINNVNTDALTSAINQFKAIVESNSIDPETLGALLQSIVDALGTAPTSESVGTIADNIDTLADTKLDKSAVEQSTGSAEDKVMSQKAVTEELTALKDSGSGFITLSVMSGGGVTSQIAAGEYGYNLVTKQIFARYGDGASDYREVVPDAASKYVYNNKVYVWNGTELVFSAYVDSMVSVAAMQSHLKSFLFEQGGVENTSGALLSSNTRIRSSIVKDDIVISLPSGYSVLIVAWYNESDNSVNSTLYANAREFYLQKKDGCYARFSVGKSGDTDFTVDDFYKDIADYRGLELSNLSSCVYIKQDISEKITGKQLVNQSAANISEVTEGTNAAFKSIRIDLSKVKSIILTCAAGGGEAARLWAFYDADGNRTRIASNGALHPSGLVLKPRDNETTCIINVNITNSYSLVVEQPFNETLDNLVVQSTGLKAVSDNIGRINMKSLFFEQGGVAIASGALMTQTNRIRTVDYIDGGVYSLPAGFVIRSVVWYDRDTKRYDSGEEFNTQSVNATKDGCVARLTICKQDASEDITVDELYFALNNLVVARLEQIRKREECSKFQFGETCNFDYSVPDMPQLTLPPKGQRLSYFYELYDRLLADYPEYISKIDCDQEMIEAGVEVPDYMNGYPIYMYKFMPARIPNNSSFAATQTSQQRLKVFIVTATHGSEYTAIFDMYQTMRLVCESWKSDNNLAELRWNADIYILPCSSPYAVDNGTRTNARGVDPMRNAPSSKWVKIGSLGDNVYSGEEPGSEYETQVFMHYLEAIQPHVYIDHHNTNTGSGSNIGDNKNLIYTICYDEGLLNLAAVHISQMTRKWKQRFTGLFPQDDDTTIYGFAKFGYLQEQYNGRMFYAHEKGCLSVVYESNQATLYKDGEFSTDNRQTNTAEIITMATDGFLNFLLRVLKYVSTTYMR